MATQLRPSESDLTRRRFLQGSALAGVAAFIAACGTKGASNSAPASTAPSVAASSAAAGGSASAAASEAASPSAAASAATNVGGILNFANWIGYIDVDDSGAK